MKTFQQTQKSDFCIAHITLATDDDNVMWSYEILETDDLIYLQSVYVQEKYRGCGHFRTLMDTFVVDATIRRYLEIHLRVKKDNLIAYNMYKKYGFVDVSEDNLYILMKIKL